MHPALRRPRRCLSKRLLLELFLNRQAQLGELFDVATRMKLQLLELGKNDDFLQLC